MACYNVVVPEFYHRDPSYVHEQSHSLGNLYTFRGWPEWPTVLYTALSRFEQAHEVFMVVSSYHGTYAAWVPDMGAFYHHRAVVQQKGYSLLGFYAIERQQALHEIIRGDLPSSCVHGQSGPLKCP